MSAASDRALRYLRQAEEVMKGWNRQPTDTELMNIAEGFYS